MITAGYRIPRYHPSYYDIDDYWPDFGLDIETIHILTSSSEHQHYLTVDSYYKHILTSSYEYQHNLRSDYD